MTRVLIADDHVIVRKGMIQVLSTAEDITVAGEANDGYEALDRIKAGGYDVVVIDIALPGRNGLETLKQIKIEYPDLPVLILSMYPEDHYALRVLKAGGAGYITKDNASTELAEAIRIAARGRKYITNTLAEKLAGKLHAAGENHLHENLSDREFNILCLIAKGKSNSEIADDLSLGIKTVATYRSRLLEKMGMKSNSELTYYAVQNRLVE